jgi:hypothetical protein
MIISAVNLLGSYYKFGNHPSPSYYVKSADESVIPNISLLIEDFCLRINLDQLNVL